MNIKNILRTAAVALLAVAAPALAGPGVINLEEAAEIEKLQIQIVGTTDGVVYGRMCDQCKMRRLTIDANTSIRRDRTKLTLQQAAKVSDVGATVLFDPDTDKVTRIIFWY